MLEIVRVSKSFGAKKALQAVSLKVQEGECFGLIGPNGAGKTTLINLISGFLLPSTGEIFFQGNSLNNGKANRTIIGVVPQEIALYENMTSLDNLKYFGELHGLSGNGLARRIDELLDWIQLRDRKKEKVKFLSGGMKRRLNLIAGLLHHPKLLLLDEPTVGVDPQARLFLYHLIEELRREKIAILYTTHYIPEAEQLCDAVAILDQGKIVAQKKKEMFSDLEKTFFELTGKDLRE